MGALIISDYILIETRSDESDKQFCAAIEDLVVQSYGHKPDWLQFSAGVHFIHGNRHFREFRCIAGSVSLNLMQCARKNSDFQRAIIYHADNNGIGRAYEIRAGVQTEFSPNDLHAVKAGRRI